MEDFERNIYISSDLSEVKVSSINLNTLFISKEDITKYYLEISIFHTVKYIEFESAVKLDDKDYFRFCCIEKFNLWIRPIRNEDWNKIMEELFEHAVELDSEELRLIKDSI
jgi:hypothetical protein